MLRALKVWKVINRIWRSIYTFSNRHCDYNIIYIYYIHNLLSKVFSKLVIVSVQFKPYNSYTIHLISHSSHSALSVGCLLGVVRKVCRVVFCERGGGYSFRFNCFGVTELRGL